MLGVPETVGLVIVWALVLFGLLALARRRYPTVWPGAILRPLGLAVGVAFVLAGAFQPAGAMGAALPLAVTLFSAFRPRDFLVLFGRVDPMLVVQDALQKLGVSSTPATPRGSRVSCRDAPPDDS